MTAAGPATVGRGARVVLVREDGYRKFRTPAGTVGTVEFVDGLGTAHILWSTGQRFGVIAGDLPHAIRPAPDPGSADA